MLRILKSLTGEPSRVDFELDDAECAAIGRVTVHWAYLEHAVFAATLELSELLKVPLPDDAKRSSFTRRLGALSRLGGMMADERERKRFGRLIGKIANAEQDRHKMTHGLWDWDFADPERLRASSFRPGYEFEKRYDATALHELANRLGEISFSLQYPHGWDHAFTEMLAEATDENGKTAWGSVSRKFVRAVAAKRPGPSDK